MLDSAWEDLNGSTSKPWEIFGDFNKLRSLFGISNSTLFQLGAKHGCIGVMMVVIKFCQCSFTLVQHALKFDQAIMLPPPTAEHRIVI